MKIAVLGAAGRVGEVLTSWALSNNDTVHALIKPTHHLDEHPHMTIFRGDVLNQTLLTEVISECEVVVSALGTRNNQTNQKHDVLEHAANAIANALPSSNTRLIMMGAASLLQHNETTLRKDQPSFSGKLKPYADAHYKALQVVMNRVSNWLYICPPEIVAGVSTKAYRIQQDFLPENGRQITTQDLSHFILSEIHHPQFANCRIGITY